MAKKICHLTLLNPALHSRIYFKEARSQANAGYEVSIIGRDDADAPYTHEGIRIIPLASFKRVSAERYATTQRLLGLATAEQADLYHVHSPELLGIAKKIKKILPGAKIVYDMHEDYQKNIRYGGYYSPLVKGPLSSWVRGREKRFIKWGDGVIYAEECFDDLLKAGKKKVVICNKFRWPDGMEPAEKGPEEIQQQSAEGNPPEEIPAAGAPAPDSGAVQAAEALQGEQVSQAPAQKKAKARKPASMEAAERPVLLYTGTIAKPWGILSTLELWSALNEYLPVQLVVAGHSHNEPLITAVKKFVAVSGIKERFTLEGGDEYVPYEKIVEWIGKCTLGTAFYEPRENIRDRIPTKFYEFMAQEKPLLFTHNAPWNALNEKYNFGASVKFPMREEIIQQIAEWITAPKKYFYPSPVPPSAWSWESEAEKLLDFTDRLL